MVNKLTQAKCKELYKAELKNPRFVAHLKTDSSTLVKTDKDGCIITLRKCESTGYPVVQLSLEDVPEEYKSSKKQQRKVFIHHLAYRGRTGNSIVDDIVHTCGKGKRLTAEDTHMGCINAQHLDQASHRDNMHAQNCVALHQCPCCDHVFIDCPHVPQCTPTGPLLKRYKKQQLEKKEREEKD